MGRFGWGSLLVAVVLAVGAGCGDDGPSTTDTGTGDTGAGDSAADAGADDTGAGDSAADTGTTSDTGPVSDASRDSAMPVDSGVDAGPEVDCFDGLDDDGDGMPDCADPDCMAVAQCVPEPESGWTDPGTLRSGALGAAAPCDAPYPETSALGNSAVTGDPVTCSACECGSPAAGGTCVIEPRVCQKTSSCAGTCNAGSVSGSGCIESPETSGFFIPREGSVPRGSCSLVTDTVASGPAPAWTMETTLCTTTSLGAGCAAGERCVPRPAVAEPLCVAREGDLACPSGYGRRQLTYGAIDDSRGCSACSCAFRGDGCEAMITAYSGASCTGTELFSGAASSGSCRSGNPGSYDITLGGVINPRCLASGGVSEGCASAGDPTTICCASAVAETPCPSGDGPPMVEVPDASGGFFCVDSTEVTNLQYAAFLATSPSTAGQPAHCSWNTDFVPTSGWPAAAADDDDPVAYVDWCDARAYCEADGKRLCGSRTGGTLTEADATTTDSQWYYACSNGDTQSQPYGVARDSRLCPEVYGGGRNIEGVHERSCCAGPEDGLYGLMTNAVEWIDACSGTGGASDTCGAMGPYDDGDGFDCSDAVSSLRRDATQGHVGFRCCAN